MASSVYNVGEWEDEEFGMAFFSSPQIIGHRGLGANTFNNDRKTFLKPSPAIVEENNKLRQGNDASDASRDVRPRRLGAIYHDRPRGA